MNHSHTPGPWIASWGKYLPIIAIVDGKEAQIGRAESCGQISDQECEANGALIAAAPDLLAACQHVLAAYGHNAQDECGCEDCEYLRPITNAVKKALGHKDQVEARREVPPNPSDS